MAAVGHVGVRVLNVGADVGGSAVGAAVGTGDPHHHVGAAVGAGATTDHAASNPAFSTEPSATNCTCMLPERATDGGAAGDDGEERSPDVLESRTPLLSTPSYTRTKS